MELTTLQFKVDTKELEGVITVLDNVATSVKKLNEVQRLTESTSKKQSKATEDAAKATDKLAESTENLGNSTTKSEKLLERLKNTHSDLVNGMTRGESSILNQARALGVAEDALGPYIEQLKLIKSLTKDPFDQSIGAIRSVQAEYDKLLQRSSLASKGIALTNKQLEEYSRISSEIKGKIIQMGIDPKSAEGQAKFNQELEKTQAEYLGVVKRVNDLTASEKQLTEALRESERIAKSIREQGWKEYAASIGKSSDEIKELNQWYKELETQSNKVAEANEKLNASIERTNKITQMVKGGMSEREATKRVDLSSQGIDEAQINKLIAAENALIATRQRGAGVDREKLNAIKYIQREDERLSVVIRELTRAEEQRNGKNVEGSNIDERRARSLANYERNLRQAGISGEEAAKKLDQFRIIQDKIAKAEEAKAVQFLQRGLQPQIGDVAVSLASGQNPLTVMLQQGDQIRALIAQTGVQGAALQKAFKEAMAGTLESIKITASAMLNLLGGAVTTLSGMLTTGFVGAAAAVIALGVAFYKTQKQQDELTKGLILTGANLGMSTSMAMTLAKSMEEVGVSTSKSIDIITAFAKEGAGNFSQMQNIIPAVAGAMKHLGLTAEDMAKQYKAISKDPVEALIDLAVKTGLVDEQTIKMVNTLVESGDRTKAVAVAIDAANNVYVKAAKEMQKEYSTLGEIFNATGSFFSKFWDGVKNLVYRDSALDKLKSDYEQVSNRIKEVKENLESNAKIGIKTDPALLNQLTAQQEALREQLSLIEKQQAAEARVKEENSKAAEAQRVALSIDKQLNDEAEKRKASQLQLNEYIDWYVKKKKEDANQKAAGAGDRLNLDLLREAAKLEWERGKVAKAAAKEIRDINKSYESDMETFNRLTERAIGQTLKLTKAEVEYNRIRNTKEYSKYSEDQKRSLEIAKERAVIEEKVSIILKDAYKYNKQLKDEDEARLALRRKYSEEAEKELLSLTLQSQDLEFRNSLLGKSNEEATKLTIEYEKQRKILQASLEYEAQIKKIREDFEKNANKTDEKGNKVYTFDIVGYTNALDEAMKIRLMKEANASQEAAFKTAEIYSKEFERIAGGISDAIATALFEGGQAGRKKLRDVIVAELRKPITLYINAVVKDIFGGTKSSGNLLDSISSLFGGGQQGGSGAGGLAGTLSSLSSLFGEGSTVGGMLSSLGSSAAVFGSYFKGGSAMAMQGNAMASFQGAYSNFMSGSYSASAGQAAGTIAPYMMAYSLGKKVGQEISGGYSAIGGSSGNTAVNAGAMIGSIWGPLGTAAGAAIGGLVNRAFGRKLKESGIEGTFSSSGFSGNNYRFEKGGWFRSDKTIRSALDSETQSMFNDTFAGIKTGTEILAKSLGLGTQAIENFSYSIKLNLKDLSEAESTKRIEEEFNKITESLALTVMGTTQYTKAGETNFQTLTRLSQTLVTTNAIFSDLGWTLYETSLAGAASAEEFLTLLGGMESASSALNAYYQNFYSEEDRLAKANENLANKFKELGIAMPTDKLEYRAAVEKALAEGNNELAVALIKLSSTFAELHPEVVESTGELETVSEVLKSLREESANLNVELLRAQGKTEEANAAFRALSTEGMKEMEIALWDANRAVEKQISDLNTKTDLERQLLQAQGNTAELRARELATLSPANQEIQKLIWSLQDQAAETQKAEQAAAELAAEQSRIANERYNLETQLLQAQGDTAALRARELEKLDPTNREIQKLIWSLQDQAVASQQAAQAAAELAAEQERVASERYSLETQLLQMQGKTAELRERELLKLDPSNRALQEQIWKLEDQAKANQELEAAAQAAAAAAAEAARASEALKQAWQSVTDSIFEEVARIRGLSEGDSVMNLALAQRNFDAANAAAQSGDQEAAKTLPELSRKLLELAALSASSTAELRRFQLITAAALEGTGNKLVGTYGLTVPAFAEGGSYSGGLALVGEKGPELINFNASGQIHSAATTASMLSNDRLVELVEVLNDNIENLRYEVRADVQHNAKTAKLLDRVIKDGENISVVFDTPQSVNVV